MPGPQPLQYGIYYHIFNRGNNREDIFIEDKNYRYFLKKYTQYIFPIADTFVYCLLRNHFHLFVRIKEIDEIPEELDLISPSSSFGNLFNSYAKAFNRKYNRAGSLFQNPFGRRIVKTDRHLLHLFAYIHQNPQMHGFVNDFREWRYSSYKAILSAHSTNVLRYVVLDWFGGCSAFADFHKQQVSLNKIKAYIPEDSDI